MRARPGIRVLALAAVLLLATAGWLGCSQKSAPEPTLGDILPLDTLAWVHMEDLPALEDALTAWGLMDLLVEKLSEHEAREDFQANLGIELADDPRETIHALMQELVRADVSGHAPLHEGDGEPVILVHLECVDDAAAERILAMVAPHSSGEIPIGTVTAMILNPREETQLLVGRTGAHVLMSSEAERFGQTVGDMASPPVAGLTSSEHYQTLQDGAAHQVAIYVTPDAQSEFRGIGPMPPGFNPATMGPLMEKYGSQYSFTGTDYLLSSIVSRQMLTEGSALMPLMQNPTGKGELVGWMPADAFMFKTGLVENGRVKMELIQQLIVDITTTASAAMDQPLAPMQQDPFAAAEAALGFSLPDLADRLQEWAIAGTADAGWQILLRGKDEAMAEEILQMFAVSPALAMLGPGTELVVRDITFTSYIAPMDNSGKLNLLGRRGDTVMMLVMAQDELAVQAFLAQIGTGALAAEAPAHVARALDTAGCVWGYLDLVGMMHAVGQDPEDNLADLPPALAARLRGLKMAGHMESLAGGMVETVLEMGQPIQQ